MHKVSLYADDMLLDISAPPLLLLPELLCLLGKCKEISGYKVNIQKSELITPADRTNVGSTSFKISPRKFKYLGIWATCSYKDLYKFNSAFAIKPQTRSRSLGCPAPLFRRKS